MQSYISIGIVIYALCSVAGGWLADNISPRIVASIAALIIICLSIIQCYFFRSGKLSLVLFLCNCGLLPLVNTPCLTLLKSFIPKVIRHRLFSLIHSLGSITISAPCPVISTWLYSKTKLAWLPLAYFIIILLLMTLVLNLLFWLQPKSK